MLTECALEKYMEGVKERFMRRLQKTLKKLFEGAKLNISDRKSSFLHERSGKRAKKRI